MLCQTLWKITQSLIGCSFAAHLATETYCTILETSKPTLFGAKRVRLEQDFESSKSLVGNMPKWRVSLQATVSKICEATTTYWDSYTEEDYQSHVLLYINKSDCNSWEYDLIEILTVKIKWKFWFSNQFDIVWNVNQANSCVRTFPQFSQIFFIKLMGSK